MNFDIKQICEYGNDIPKKILSLLNEEQWDIFTERQKQFHVHRFTESIRIRHVKNMLTGDMQIVNYEVFDLYKPIIEEYLNILSNYFDIKNYTALIVNMIPGGYIDTHVDGGIFLEIAHRLHIPIKTNKNVFFTVENKTINMEVGKIYEINNSKPHSVKNNSFENRIHLILDIFEVDVESLLHRHHK